MKATNALKSQQKCKNLSSSWIVGNPRTYPETGFEEMRTQRPSTKPYFPQADFPVLIGPVSDLYEHEWTYRAPVCGNSAGC
jgi:hypothetical protein